MDDSLALVNLEAEEAVLGSILINPDTRYEIGDLLTDTDFYDERNQIIYRAMVQIDGNLDALTLADVLNDDKIALYLLKLLDHTPTHIHATHYARIVRRDADRRRYMAAAEKISRKAYQCQDADEVAAYANAQLLNIERNGQHSTAAANQLASDFYDRLEAWSKEPLTDDQVRGLDTGFEAVNRLTEGYKPGDLWIVCGRPGMGKSAFAFETARRVAERGGRVLIFSLEMTKEAVFERWVAAISGVEARIFRRGRGNIPACLGAILKLETLKTLWIDDQPALTPTQVRSRAIRKARKEGGLDLIIVDHVRKMQLDGGRGENTAKTEGRKTAAMKDLAKELRCPLLLAAQLNRGVEGRAEKRPSLGDLRDCLTDNARVISLIRGLIPISQVEVGEYIVAFNQETMNLTFERVMEVMHKGTQRVFEVVTKTGRRVEATSNHPFLTPDGWCKLEDLEVGTIVATTERLPQIGLSICFDEDLELCELLGYMAGDGSYQHHRGLSFTSTDQDFIDAVRQLVERHFPAITIRTKEGKRKKQFQTLEFVRIFENGYGRPGGNPLRSWLSEIGIEGQGCHTKTVAPFVFKMGLAGMARFLGGYLATDGCVKCKLVRKKPVWEIHFDSVSLALAQDVQTLLTFLGIISVIDNPTYKNRKHPIYRVRISSMKNNLLRFAELVQTAGRKQRLLDEMRSTIANAPSRDMFGLPNKVSRLAAKISWRDWRNVQGTISKEKALEIAEKFENHQLYKWATSPVMWEPIRSISELPPAPTWDISVPGTWSFIANGIIVHNSGEHEEEADGVLGLYRDEYYNPNTEQRNILELLALKQREGPSGANLAKLSYDVQYQRFRDVEFHTKPIEERI